MRVFARARVRPWVSEACIDWEAAFTEQLPRVLNYLRYRVGDSQLAEDLTAATFEKAWRSRKRFDQRRGSVTTWIFTIARNTAADHFRRRRPEEGLEAALEGPPDSTPEQESEHQETRLRLVALLEGLPPRERELLALKYGADMTNREIARITGLSETNVGTILHRTVVRLRDSWEESA